MSHPRRVDEYVLWAALLDGISPREAGYDYGIPPQRVRYLCEKWARKGFYSYGVTCDLGWVERWGYVQPVMPVSAWDALSPEEKAVRAKGLVEHVTAIVRDQIGDLDERRTTATLMREGIGFSYDDPITGETVTVEPQVAIRCEFAPTLDTRYPREKEAA